MGRFEKITKIDGYEVTLVTSYNNMDIYIEILVIVLLYGLLLMGKLYTVSMKKKATYV